MQAPHASRLSELGQRLATGLVAAVLTATAGAIALVATAFALYAALQTWTTPAGASAATAAAFAALCGALAVIAPRLGANAPESSSHTRRQADQPAHWGLGLEIAVAVVTGVIDIVNSASRHCGSTVAEAAHHSKKESNHGRR